MKSITRILLVVLVASAFTGCGGGGGGGGFFGAARVNISANPGTIFVGDRTLITTTLEDVNEEGIVLIYRYPSELSYVRATAKLYVGNDEVEVAPLMNQARNERIYLVFVFSSDTFGNQKQGRLELQLLGLEEIDRAKIEVDPNIRDKDLPDNQQFDIANPVFGTDKFVEIRVRAE